VDDGALLGVARQVSGVSNCGRRPRKFLRGKLNYEILAIMPKMFVE
jgi:hypothetical protein